MKRAEQLEETVRAWQEFCSKNDWQKLIESVTPKQTGCGPVYALQNYLNRPGESFAIADMRNVKVAEPHYHPAPSIEIYLVLQGHALVVVGGEERQVGSGDAVIIPPDTAHYTIPENDFVIAAINLPEFQPEHHITVDPSVSNPLYHFGADQFGRMTS